MRVLMVGVSAHRVGGMWSVAQNYINSPQYNEKVKMFYIATSTNGSKIVRFLFMVKGYCQILLMLLFGKINLIHIHMAAKGSTYRKGCIVKLAKLFRKRIVIHLHAGRYIEWYNTLSDKQKEKVKSIFEKADKVLVLGEYWKKEIECITDRHKVEVLYNGVREQDKNSYNCLAQNLVYFGMLSKSKGIYDLLKAIKIIDEKLDKTIKVLLCGVPVEENVTQIIEEYELGDRIKLLGWVDGEEKEKIYKCAMIDILPSYYEGLSMSIIEAMSYGIPVITTRISTMEEVVGNSEYLINPGDYQMLAEKILDLVTNEENRRKISEYLYNRACTLFAEEKFIENSLKIYEKVCG